MVAIKIIIIALFMLDILFNWIIYCRPFTLFYQNRNEG